MRQIALLTFALVCFLQGLAQTDVRPYETLDVSQYRHRVNFEMPNFVVKQQPVPAPVAQSLMTKYFQNGQKVYIDADQNLDAFVAAHVAINENSSSKQAGYRIQVFAGSRDGANIARAKALRNFANFTAYLIPIEPNYRVRVGDFTSRGEAQVICDQMRSTFPSAWVVKDNVNVQ